MNQLISRNLILIAGWVLALVVMGYGFESLTTYKPTFPYADVLIAKYGSRLLTKFAQFDGVHYLTIVEKGYRGTELIQAFFPIYPMLVKFFSLGFINPVWVGMLISLACFSLGVEILNRYITEFYPKIKFSNVLGLMLLFPVGWFWASLYTESLFFLLIISYFYLLKRGNLLGAAIISGLATGTRLVGVALPVILVIKILFDKKQWKLKNGLILMASIIGILGYMYYLKTTFNDPLLFINAQEKFGTGREVSRLISPPQVLYRYFKILKTIPINSGEFYVALLEMSAFLGGTWLMVKLWQAKQYDELILVSVGILLPTMTGTFNSMPRYLLPLFPLYLTMAQIDKKYLRWIMIIFGGLLVLNWYRFTCGLWVA